jgi:hypothetical protein
VRVPRNDVSGQPITSVRLPPSLRRTVVQLAEVERRSVSGQIVHLLEKGIAAAGEPSAQRLFEGR